jgi:anaerobic selenocysteine-containing dehydrogenase
VGAGERWLGLEGVDGLPACDDCVAAARALGDPARPGAPLVRARGAAERLTAVRWDEAHDRLAAALSEAVAGRARLVWISGARHPRLSHALARRVAHFVPGTRLLLAAGARAAAARAFAALLEPDEIATPEAVATADLLVSWGADPARLPRAAGFAWRRAAERGVERLFVDPCAAAADGGEWAQLGAWPGTDVPLALALAEALLASGSARCAPEAALRAEIERWPPSRAAGVARVSEAAFAAAAERLARARRAVIVVGGGAARHGEAASGAAAIVALARAAGARLLVPAIEPNPALLVPMPVGTPPVDDASEPAWGAPALPEDGRGVVLVVEEAEQFAGRGGWGGLERLARTARLAVVLGQHPGALAREASIFLPVAGHLEQEDVVGLGGAAWRGEAARPAPRGVLPATAVFRAAARRLGWPERWFPAEPAAWVAEAGDRAAPAPAVGRAAAAPVLREPGEGPRSTPALFERYPLALVVGRLDDRRPVDGGSLPPALLMEPGDAARRGLADGARALVANDRGRLVVTVRCEARQPARVVAVLPRGPGLPAELGPLFPDPAPSGGAGGAAITLVEVGPAGAA